MAPKTEPDSVTFSYILPDGGEMSRTAQVWAPAPTIAGNRAFWVIPDHPIAGEPPVIVIVIASKRHRVGRVIGGGRFGGSSGRFVDKGEVYAEADHRSRSRSQRGDHVITAITMKRVITRSRHDHRSRSPITAIRTIPLPPDVMASLRDRP